MAETKDYLSGLNLPVGMIHSLHDENDSIQKAQAMFSLLPGPKEFLAINAVNHRFSDREPEVTAAVETFLRWMERPSSPE